jgi:hypothetical protein
MARSHKILWTQDLDQIIKENYGLISAAQIALLIGTECTRSMVIGRAGRIMKAPVVELDAEAADEAEEKKQKSARLVRQILACDLLLARLFRHHPDHAIAALNGIQPIVVDLEPPPAPVLGPVEWEDDEEPPPFARQVRVSRIINCTADHFGFTADALRGPVRDASMVNARHIAMYLAREITLQGWIRLGRHFGKDHTSVIHAHKRITDALPVNDKLQKHIRNIKILIGKSFVVPRISSGDTQCNSAQIAAI